MICLIFIIMVSLSSNVYGVHKDFGVIDYKNSPLELLEYSMVVDRLISNVNIEEIESNVLRNKILSSSNTVLAEAIISAESYADKNSLTKEGFFSEFIIFLEKEDSIVFKFYNDNLRTYKEIVKKKYDKETYNYYLKEYLSVVEYKIRLLWTNGVISKIAWELNLHPLNQDKKLISYLNSKGCYSINEQVLYIISPAFRKKT